MAPGAIETWGPYRRWQWYREASRDHAKYWNDRDPAENRDGRLPAWESIEVPAIWVVELYTPSTVEGLLGGIERLGWETRRSGGDDILKWMADIRHGRAAGWTALGLVSSTRAGHLMTERSAELPSRIQAAQPMLMSVMPSITALVTCFILTDDAAKEVNLPLRREFATFTTRDDRFRRRHLFRYVIRGGDIHMGSTIHAPDFQRRDEVVRTLDSLEADCTAWVAKQLPGAFAGGLRRGLFPTSMLFVSERRRLMREHLRLRALEGAELDRAFDAFQTDEWPRARLLMPRGFRREDLRVRFACRRRDAFPPRNGYPDPSSNWTIAQRADDLVRGLAVRWAISCLLEGYAHRLSALRDATAGKHRLRPVRDLKTLRDFARKDLLDIRSSTSELARFAKSPHYVYDTIEPRYVRPIRGSHPALLEHLREAQESQCAQLQQDADHLLMAMSATTDVTQTISNIRLQRIVLLVTIVSVVVAAIALAS